MYIIDHNTGIALSDQPLTQPQQTTIFSSPNAMRGLVYPQTSLPAATYLQANNLDDDMLLGAVLWESSPDDSAIAIHPLVIIKHLPTFHTITDLAILFALNQNLKPYTTVLPTPAYSYMHEFVMETVGCLWTGVGDVNTYRLPHGWRPRMVKKYTIGME